MNKDVSSDLLYLMELVACLYQPPRASMLIVDLRYVARVANDLADKLEAENDKGDSV